MKHVVVKTLVLSAAVLAFAAACWSTTGAPSVGMTIAGPGTDPNQPPDPNRPEMLLPEMGSSAGPLIWLIDEPADPNDPNDPNIPERSRATARRA